VSLAAGCQIIGGGRGTERIEEVRAEDEGLFEEENMKTASGGATKPYSGGKLKPLSSVSEPQP